MKKYVFFAFKGDIMCFNHVLINAIEMHSKGVKAIIVLEGEAVKVIKELDEADHPVYQHVRELGLFDSVCKACSIKMGVYEYNKTCGIPFNDELNGHPSMLKYLNEGYEMITL